MCMCVCVGRGVTCIAHARRTERIEEITDLCLGQIVLVKLVTVAGIIKEWKDLL